MKVSDDETKEFRSFLFDSCVNEEQGHTQKNLSKQINLFLNESITTNSQDSPTNYSNLDNDKANNLFFLFGQS